MSDNYTSIQRVVDEQDKQRQEHVSLSTKEAEPIKGPTETGGVIQEIVEAQPPADVSEFVQSRAETIKLPPDIKKMGVVAVSEPVFKDEQELKLPISDDKIVEGLKQPITSSFRWLSELMRYLLRQAHLTLKTFHGKVVRQPIRE